MADFDTIVIGSGPGGLAAAVALARAGEKVLVLEQHYLPGGWAHSFTLEDHRFSPGVHYIGELGLGGRTRRLYEGLGVSDDLTFLELEPNGYDHLRVGDERFDVPKGVHAYMDRLSLRFPSERKGIAQLFKKIIAMNDALAAPPQLKPGQIMSELKRCRTLALWGMRSWQSLLDAHIADPLLRAYLSLMIGNHGMPPEQAPAALHSAIMAHYFDGAAYPMGGGAAIPRAFIRQLKHHGGELRMRSRVRRILTERKLGRHAAIGVELEGGEQISARNVISNADPHVTYGSLLDPSVVPKSLQRRVKKTRWSVPLMMAFCATDLDLEAMGLDSGNYWFSKDTDVGRGFRRAMRGEALPDGPADILFLTVTTLKDRSKFDGQNHTVELFTPVSWEEFAPWTESELGQRPPRYEATKRRIANSMLQAADTIVPGLSKRLVFEDIGSPLSSEFYVAATRGGAYGTEKSRWQVGPFGFQLSSPIANLRLCGASTLAHGVLGATMTGVLAAAEQLHMPMERIIDGPNQGAPLLVVPASAQLKLPTRPKQALPPSAAAPTA